MSFMHKQINRFVLKSFVHKDDKATYKERNEGRMEGRKKEVKSAQPFDDV